MKKTLLIVIVIVSCCLLSLVVPALAADRPCKPIWDRVAGHSFTWSVGEDVYRIDFSDSYVGPCPQGVAEIYDGVYIAPRLTIPYVSGRDFVILQFEEGAELKLFLTPTGLEQIVFPPDRIILKPLEKMGK